MKGMTYHNSQSLCHTLSQAISHSDRATFYLHDKTLIATPKTRCISVTTVPSDKSALAECLIRGVKDSLQRAEYVDGQHKALILANPILRIPNICCLSIQLSAYKHVFLVVKIPWSLCYYILTRPFTEIQTLGL